MEDSGVEEMMAEESTDPASILNKDLHPDEGIDVHSGNTPPHEVMAPELGHALDAGVIRTLDGEEIEDDEMKQDAMNYQILNAKIDELLNSLRLDA